MKKLHIGCGKRNFGDDWDHIDGETYPHIIHNDITQLPYPNNSIDIIYASHVIEYFDRSEVIVLLSHWHDVLKIGGILRVAVPDFEAICKLYLNNSMALDTFLGPLYGKMKLRNDYIYHKTVYDFQSLSSVLQQSNYTHVQKYNWRDTEHSHFDDHSQAYIPHMDKNNGTLISLNVEAIKA